MLSAKEINLLEAQNEGLKKQNAELQKENVELKAENERLRDNIKSISQPVLLPYVPIKVTNKYKQILQEIKAIAEEIADTENWLNCGYNASRAKKILGLITKAESEVK